MLKYKVLLVDDEEEVANMIEERINWEELGFEVTGKAQNGVKALEISEKVQPDVVITDIKMPYMNGLVTILVMIFLDPFARFLGATDHILPYARTYIGTIAPFSVVYILSYSFETLIKTDGYPKLATIYVTSGAVLNCILLSI